MTQIDYNLIIKYLNEEKTVNLNKLSKWKFDDNFKIDKINYHQNNTRILQLILSCITKDYEKIISMKDNLMEYKMDLKKRYQNDQLFNKYNHLRYGYSVIELIEIINYENVPMILKIYSDFYQINLLLFKELENQMTLIHANEEYNALLPTILIYKERDNYYPIISDKKTFSYNDNFIKEFIKNGVINEKINNYLEEFKLKKDPIKLLKTLINNTYNNTNIITENKESITESEFNFDKLKKQEIIQLLKQKNIKFNTKMKKEDLIKLIT
jgi:hypothetical protein